MSGSRLRPYLGPVVALLVVLALGAGTVYAAIPNGDGKYYACYVKNTGAVKLINYPKVKTCKAGEKLINWNAKGPQGPAGPQGVQGPKGDPGPAGAAGITKITVTQKYADLTVPGGDDNGLTVTCDAGKVVGGGFYQPYTPATLFTIIDSYPNTLTSWRVYADNASGSPVTVRVYAVCMTTDPSAVIARASNSRKHK